MSASVLLGRPLLSSLVTGAFRTVRQGQQNRRGRGRNNNNNNNNRKHQNPLSRSFESNGPDVKIRGTPAHIAEKYMALARDAQSSGDHVLAENYLQHAEHYNRIIMAYREQFAPQHGEGTNGHGRQPAGEGSSEDAQDEDNEDILDEGFQNAQSPSQYQPRQPDAPRFDGNGRDHGRDHRAEHRDHRNDRPFRRDQGRFRDRNGDQQRGDHRDRQMRDDRQPLPTRDDRPPMRESREERPVRDDRPAREERQHAPEQPGEQGEHRRPQRERFQQPHEQPDFLRRPVRRPRSENSDAPAPSAAGGKDEVPRE